MAESIGLRITEPRFWDEADLRSEVDRIFDVCHGCRLCFKFCGSFPRLFDAIDGRTAAKRKEHLDAHPELVAEAERRRAEAAGRPHPSEESGLEVAETFGDELAHLEGHASELSRAEIDEVVDLCFQCKLCYPNCPYTPPHDYALDFPRLLLRWKAQRARREGSPLPLRMLRRPDLIGKLGSLAPGLVNAAARNRAGRWLMERLAGVHREKELPPVHRETFPRWWRKRHRPAPAASRAAVEEGDLPTRVVLFSTCLVDYNDPGVGRAAVEVLERNGVEVQWPGPQPCCGMPRLDGGEVDAAAQAARAVVDLLAPWVERGYRVVIPSPSCSLMVREEMPQLLGDEASRAVATASLDLCDYLFRLSRAGRVDKSFVRRLGLVKYHVPCHIRAQQAGFRGRDVLKWVADRVEVVQECSGHDGTWSMLKENFADSLRWGRKAAIGLQPAAGEGCSAACSDCGLAALHLRQGGGVNAVHPVVALAYAYGFEVGKASAHLAPAEIPARPSGG